MTALVKYSAEYVWAQVEADKNNLFLKYSTGRPENWKCSERVKDTICLMEWFAKELRTLPLTHDDWINQQYYFNRLSRGSCETAGNWDLFELAATLMNEASVGNIYIPNPRWRRH